MLQSYLLQGLEMQKTDYELITIDNTKGAYSSAAGALNEGGSTATGVYLVFVHQDVELSPDFLARAEEIMESMGVEGA